MSDAEDKQNQKPTPETAAVPLKKETIRVTLRANPDASSAELPAAAPPKPSAPKAPAPTIPIAGGAPKPAAPAPTVRLNTPSKPITPGGAPAAPVPTKPLSMPGAPSTAPLPKATVNLSTTPLPAASPTSEVELNESDFAEDTGMVELAGPTSNVVPMVLSVIVFLVAALVLYLEYQSNQLVDAGFQVFGG